MRIARKEAVLLAAVFATVVSGLNPASGNPGTTKRINSRGEIQGNGHTPARSVPDTTSPALSEDGLSVAYSSDASNLVPNDTNGVADIFLQPSHGGPFRRISTDKYGRQANGASYSPVLSVDSKFLVFVSEASNLIPADTNGVADIFLKNLKSGSVRRVSVSSSRRQANGPSRNPFVSLYGNYITFDSEATNLAEGDDNGLSDAFLYEVDSRQTQRLVPADPGENSTTIHSEHASVNFDGTIVAYQRTIRKDNLETPVDLDVFVWNRKKRKTHRIDMRPWAGLAKKMLEAPVLTADGRYVAYEAWSAIDLKHTVGGQNGFGISSDNDDALAPNPYDMRTIYMYDHDTEVHFPVSTNPAGPQANGDCYDAAPNAYGTIIAFTCDATNMVAGDTNEAPDVFVRDLPGGVTARMSVGNDHGEGFGVSTRPSLSWNGRVVAFASTISTLVQNDTNSLDDIFLRDRHIEIPNKAPDLVKPFESRVGLNVLEEFTFQMKASDPDKDIIRFGAILGMPEGARIDPVTGWFNWTPTPDQTDTAGKTYDIVLWAADPRGNSDFELLQLIVRDIRSSITCPTLNSNCID